MSDIKRLNIKNFRIFKELNIKKIKKINLIAGKNNSGKSSLLEAILLHTQDLDMSIIYQILSSRDELKIIGNANISPLKYFFNDFIIEKDTSISIESNGRKSEITFCENSENVFFLITQHNNGKNILQNKVNYYSHDVFEYMRPLSNLRRNIRSRFNNIQTINVSTSTEVDHMLLLWDRICLTDKEKHIVDALKIIDDRISAIGMIQSEDQRTGRFPIVKLNHIETPVPLKSLGDGMKRIFQIILALVNCENGFLLIDEFENGLHWSVLTKLWNIIFTLSNAMNIQVFCTTHSHDCIKSFAEIWNNQKQTGNFFRVDNNYQQGTIKIVNYDHKTLITSLDFDVEMR